MRTQRTEITAETAHGRNEGRSHAAAVGKSVFLVVVDSHRPLYRSSNTQEADTSYFMDDTDYVINLHLRIWMQSSCYID